jgi:hypothetical protein
MAGNHGSHDLCDKEHERRVEARVQDLLEAVDNSPPERIRPCDLQKLINFLKLERPAKLMVFQTECFRRLPRQPLVHLKHLINHCMRISHFPTSWKDAKFIALPKPGGKKSYPRNRPSRPIGL